MMRLRTLRFLALALLAATAANAAPRNDAGAKASAPLPAPTAVSAPVAIEDQEDDPHSSMGGGGHAHGQKGAAPEAPPEDTSAEDPSLPPATIAIEMFDENDKPLPNTVVTVGVVRNTVAKGESRERIVRTTDGQGHLRLDKLDRAGGTAYRVTSGRDGATFAAPPFQLPERAGIRVKLHVYPVVKSVEEALVVTQAFVVVELKDDRVQFTQAYGIFNFGRTAWLADLPLKFPDGFTGFASQQGMSDVGLDPLEKVGAKLRGTIGPGQHEVEFRWQLPYDGEREISLEAPLTPHLATARVIVPASGTMKVKVEGFPEPKMQPGGDGQRALVTEKQFAREEAPLSMVRIALSDLPTQGSGRYVAAGISLGSVALGIVFLATRKKDEEREAIAPARRAQLLESLAELEDAHARGDVGPKTYERERRELIDEIAATYAT